MPEYGSAFPIPYAGINRIRFKGSPQKEESQATTAPRDN
jgi:hypothetical protein